MYNENNRGVNWKSVILRGLIIIAVIVIILLLLPKKSNIKAFYSNVFRENISYMQEAGESYYTNDRLPKNIGDTSEITLQEMIDKNLIIPFVDKDGKDCDTKSSYVQVTKKENEYVLKTNLVCGSEHSYVEKTLGCYDYCEDCNKKEEVKQQVVKPVKKEETKKLEYQFKQAYTTEKTTYTCGKDFDNAGTYNEYTQCKKTTATDDSKITKTTTYTCGKDFDNAGTYKEKTTCTKLTKTKPSEKSTTTYTCGSEYDNAGTYNKYTQCKKTETVPTSKTETAKATAKTTTTTTYACGSYYDNAGTYDTQVTCTKSYKQYKDIIKVYEGMKNTSVCTSKLLGKCVAYKQEAVYSYTCPCGYTKSGTTCYKTVTETEKAIKNTKSTTTYTCGSEYDNAGTYNTQVTCTKKVSGTTSKVSYAEPTKKTTKSYVCGSIYDNAGTYKDYTECLKTIKTPAQAYTKITSTCKNGCLKTTTAEPKVNTEKITNYKYQWSEKSSLEGWTFTGVTR